MHVVALASGDLHVHVSMSIFWSHLSNRVLALPAGLGISPLSLSLFLSFSLSFSVSHWPAGEAGQRGPKARARREPEGPEQAASYYF